MSESGETKKDLSRTEFYDPFTARSKKTSFDHMVFDTPWTTDVGPTVEKTNKINKNDKNHGK